MTGRVGASVVLETCVGLVFHAVLVTSVFFLAAGHNAPGGGFIGGLVGGSAFVLRYLVGTGEDAERLVRVRPTTVLGAGLLLSGGAAVVPWVLGRQVLESGYRSVAVPAIGEVPLTTVLVFDTGVYLVVVGVVLVLLATLGSRRASSLALEEPR